MKHDDDNDDDGRRLECLVIIRYYARTRWLDDDDVSDWRYFPRHLSEVKKQSTAAGCEKLLRILVFSSFS